MKKNKILILVTLVIALILAALGFASITVKQNDPTEEKNLQYYLNKGKDYYDDGQYCLW